MDISRRQRLPATPALVALMRHEAIVTALRAGTTPAIETPPVYRLAKMVVNERGAMDVYRQVQR